MAARKVKVEVVDGSVHYGEKQHQPGEQFDCDSKTAKWLEDIGAAAIVKGDTKAAEGTQEGNGE